MNSKYKEGITDLETVKPQVAAEWDYNFNENAPKDYFYGSTYRASWICSKCGHNWQATIRSRTYKETGCPVCALKIRGEKKHIDALNKRGHITNNLLLKEWDYINNVKSPTDYTEGSNESVYWVCSVCGYNYKAKISNRSKLNRGCPCCSNKTVVSGINDLATTHPEIAAEWDYNKNKLKPTEVTYGSGKKIWWICPKEHSYPATVLHRTNGGTNCPICNSGRQTSFAEQAVYFYIKKVFPDAISRYKEIFDNGMEVDIYIPSINVAIEYDGMAWHKKDKRSREKNKYNICNQNGIKLIRLKEQMTDDAKDTADYFLHIEDMYKYENLEKTIRFILDKIDPETNLWTRKNPNSFHSKIDININRDENEIRTYMTDLKNGSFEDKFPELALEWHPTRNMNLKPSMFKPGSNYIAYWECPECQNVYQAAIYHRAKGTGCPKCGIRKSAIARGRSVNMLDKDSRKIIKSFVTIADASRKTGVNASNINMVCNGQRRTAGGYAWEYNSEK